MDEKEQADRMAAAEALYMISTRVGKNPQPSKSSRRGRKKKNSEDSMNQRNGAREEVHRSSNNRGQKRGRGKRGGRACSGPGASNRGSRGTSNAKSNIGRGGHTKPGYSGRDRKRKKFAEDSSDEYLSENDSSISPSDERNFSSHAEEIKKDDNSKRKTKNVGMQRRTSQSPKGSRRSKSASEQDMEDLQHHAIGFTGAAISISETPSRRNSVESSQNLPSLGLVSGLRQVSLVSRSVSQSGLGLPSINLPSFPSELNLPSIPLELSSLQLSSQPTPNLSSLGDINGGLMEDEDTVSDREKSEKFLPLKKRKLHQPDVTSSQTVNKDTNPNPTVETSSYSDPEDRYDDVSSPHPPTAVRAPFTVQAGPIITMQTLMEIKTALTADDDGDLPLHIAVVHENMRMVVKLINLMRIAGKGVDKFNKQQQTPLHLAVKLNFLQAVDFLIKSGANINAVDCTGSSSIHMAVQGGFTKCLAILLDQCPNTDLNVRNFDGLTPLHTAVDNGDLEQVKLLMKSKAHIDVTDGKSGRTALFRAAESNQKAMVELLLQHGANPEVPNYAGVTTAMAAQGRNLHGVLKLLGSVPSDKLTEIEVKPMDVSTESKTRPVYLGFSPSKNSNSSQTAIKGENLPEPEGHVIENRDPSSNETKVFHNVFVVSQKNSDDNSSSEPMSPHVKMEVSDSLPEGILETATEKKSGSRQRATTASKSVSQPQKLSPFNTLKDSTFTSPGTNVGKELSHKATTDGSSVKLHIVPSVLSNTGTNLKQVQSVSAVEKRLKPSPQRPAAKSPTDKVTLTGMQARLYQKLLEMYNIETASTTPTTPTTPTTTQPSGKLYQSLVSSSPLPAAYTSSPWYFNPSPVNHTESSSRNSSDISTALNLSKNVKQSPTGTPPLRVPTVSSHPAMIRLPDRDGQKSSGLLTVASINSPTVGLRSLPVKLEDITPSPSPPATPLNLSKPSFRTKSLDSVSSMESVDSEAKGHQVISTFSQFASPPISGQKGKVISIGVRRLSDTDGEGRGSNPAGSQFEMFLLPPPSLPAPQEGQRAKVGGVALSSSTSQSDTKILDGQHLRQGGHMTHKPASVVRDYLTASPQPSSSTASPVLSTGKPPPVTAMQMSVPKVLDLVQIKSSKSHQPGMTLNQPHRVLGPMPVGPPIFSSSSPAFLHHGKVIDLSTSTTREIDGETVRTYLAPHLNASKVNANTSSFEQGKIVGFSGAILSVPSEKRDSRRSSGLDRRHPKVKEALPKESQRRRGRKGQKLAQESFVPTENNLGKINSETDEKLKKYLGAKKQEGISIVTRNSFEDPNVNPRKFSDGGDETQVSSHASSETGTTNKGPTYKTVGIFSGDVQHIEIGRLFSPANTSSPSHLPSQTPLATTSNATNQASKDQETNDGWGQNPKTVTAHKENSEQLESSSVSSKKGKSKETSFEPADSQSVTDNRVVTMLKNKSSHQEKESVTNEKSNLYHSFKIPTSSNVAQNMKTTKQGEEIDTALMSTIKVKPLSLPAKERQKLAASGQGKKWSAKQNLTNEEGRAGGLVSAVKSVSSLPSPEGVDGVLVDTVKLEKKGHLTKKMDARSKQPLPVSRDKHLPSSRAWGLGKGNRDNLSIDGDSSQRDEEEAMDLTNVGQLEETRIDDDDDDEQPALVIEETR